MTTILSLLFIALLIIPVIWLAGIIWSLAVWFIIFIFSLIIVAIGWVVDKVKG